MGPGDLVVFTIKNLPSLNRDERSIPRYHPNCHIWPLYESNNSPFYNGMAPSKPTATSVGCSGMFFHAGFIPGYHHPWLALNPSALTLPFTADKKV